MNALHHQPIVTSRDCPAVLIPEGTPVTLPEGSVVSVTQALGGSVTVIVNGNLVRIAGADLDAIGMEPVAGPAAGPVHADGSVDEESVWAQLRTCYDPEIPINIVELGLVYECRIRRTDEPPGNRIDVVMTLTAPGCGMGGVLVEDVRSKLLRVPNVTEVEVDLTFDPPWSQDMMSEVARLQTGLY